MLKHKVPTQANYLRIELFPPSLLTVRPCRSPEAADPANHGLSAASDVWSLAATLLHMLTGMPPYGTLDMYQRTIAMMMVEQAPPPLPRADALPWTVHQLLTQSFDFDPKRRPSLLKFTKVCS